MKFKFFIKNKILKILVFFILFLFLSYSLEDLLKDIEIISNPRMNIAQKEAAIMRINLFLASRNKEDLFKDIYVIYIDIGYEKIKALFEEIKKFFPSNIYNEIIKYIEELYKKDLKEKENIPKEEKKEEKKEENKEENKESKKDEKIEEKKETTQIKSTSKDKQSTENKEETKKDTSNTKDIPPKVTIEDILKKYGVVNTSSTKKDETKDKININNDKIEKKYTFEELEKIFREAVSNYSQKKYDLALENFLITIKNEYNSLSSAYYLGLIYEIKGDYDKSIDFFILSINIIQKSGKIDFNFLSFLYKKIGILYSFKKEFGFSKKYLLRALEYNLNDSDIYYWLGFVFYNEGDYQNALEYWKKGANLNNQKCIDSYKWLQEKINKN